MERGVGETLGTEDPVWVDTELGKDTVGQGADRGLCQD